MAYSFSAGGLSAFTTKQPGCAEPEVGGRPYLHLDHRRIAVRGGCDLPVLSSGGGLVGWSVSDTMMAQFVTDALVMAIWRRGKSDAPLHRSGHGGNYISQQSQRLMADNGIACSMNRSGNVWDNAAIESFLSSLKTKRIARKTYRTRNHARRDVFDCIPCF
jgi:hypothetical protein